MHAILFSLCYALSASTSPPRGTVGCATFPFRVGFHPFVSHPRRDGSLREGFDVGFPCLRACVLFHFAFFRLPPPATLTVRGRVLAVVCLAIALFVSPPATLAVRGRFLTGGLPYYSVCVSFSYFSSRFSWLHNQAVQRCGSGF